MTLVAVYLVVLILCGLLVLVSYIDRLYTESGKFLSREFQENIAAFEKLVEPPLLRTSQRAGLAVAVLAQLFTAAVAFLIGYLVFRDKYWTWPEIAQAIIGIILVIIICNRLLPYVLFTRTQGVWLVAFIPLLRGLIYLMLPITIALGFGLSVAALAEPHEPEEPEHPSEAVDALIEAAEEEGILEESDRQLIQSVVEFGDKTVREVMTPRPNIFAVPSTTTIEAFTTMLRDKPHSRVPVYSQSIDQMQGMVLAHDLIQIPDEQARTTTLAKLVRPVLFVPETKMTSPLLREMQRDDEHELSHDIVRESDGSYVMQGSVDMGRLRDIFDLRLDEKDTATVGGLVSAMAGRIPLPGEVIEDDGLRFEILESTARKVEKVRVTRAQSGQSDKPAREVQA